MLDGKKIVLGVTGCSPAYQVPDIIKRLKKLHGDVYVVMTENSANFITPLTLQHNLNHPIQILSFEPPKVWDKDHQSLSQGQDLLLIAPASANILGKAANGIADDLLSTTIMSSRGPKVVATHINSLMYNSPSVQRNVQTLKSDGFVFVDNHDSNRPSFFPSIDQIIDTVLQVLKIENKNV